MKRNVKIKDVASVRTGAVISRIKLNTYFNRFYSYKLLTLKCITEEGIINKDTLESFTVDHDLSDEYITKRGDILVKLCYPYTITFIDDEELVGLLVPSHFAIIRPNTQIVVPSYVMWVLSRGENRNRISLNSSVGTAFGTVSSGAIAELPIYLIEGNDQLRIGELWRLSVHEQYLLKQLAEKKRNYYKVAIQEIYNEIKEEITK